MAWSARRLGAVVLAACVSTVLGCAPARIVLAPGAPLARGFAPDGDLQRLIDPRPGGPVSGGLSWLGGDVASSAQVGPARWIWIFGDTLLGSVSDDCPDGASYCARDVDGRDTHAMIANSVGVMTLDAGGAFRPLDKYWRTIDGAPAPIFEAAAADELLWPLALAYADDVVLIAASRHTRAAGLTSVGSLLIRVTNPEAAPDQWRYERHPLPHVVAGDGTEALLWSTALVVDGEFVHLFGQRGLGLHAETVLCRFAADAVGDPGWRPVPEYLLRAAAPGGDLVWSRDFDAARLHVIPGLPGTSETAMAFDADAGWVAYQIPPLGTDIHRYTAPGLTGPWSDRGVVYAIPGIDSAGHHAYAAKSHPELATDGGEVVSYNLNASSGTVADTVRLIERTPGIYVPQLVSSGPLE
jgi:hypothetical protein